jgi:heptosyltransferase III
MGADPPVAERILMLQPRWLGDVLLCTPAIREARSAFPGARIDFVTEPPGAAALRGNSRLDEVIVTGRGAGDRLRLLALVRRRRYDAVLDFRTTGSTAQLVAISGATTRVGVRVRGPINLLYTHLLDPISLDTYAGRHKLEMLRPLGVDVDRVVDLSLEFNVGDEARERAGRFWRENGLDGQRVIAMTPASRLAYKSWGATKWGEVARTIVRSGARVLLTHGPGEREQLEPILTGGAGSGMVVFGDSSLEELGAVLARCDAWVGNDGGARHIAAAVGTPTLAVSRWRIGTVWTNPTPGVPHRFVERAPPQGCEMRCPTCEHRGCLTAIASEDVLLAMEGMERELGAEERGTRERRRESDR